MLTLIVDDEKKARDGLKVLITNHPHLELGGVCKNGLDAIEYLQQNTVDLLLLDIQMPGINGFEVLSSIKLPKSTAVIFVTAYDQFALKAFEYHAIDYLLKPFTDKRFMDAIANARELIASYGKGETQRKLDALLMAFQSQSSKNGADLIREPQARQRLVIKSSGKVIFLEHDTINWIEAYDYYIKVHVDGKYYLVRESLKNITARIPSGFLRIHKSSVVNLQKVKELEKLSHHEYEIKLVDGTLLKVSRHYRKAFDAALQLSA